MLESKHKQCERMHKLLITSVRGVKLHKVPDLSVGLNEPQHLEKNRLIEGKRHHYLLAGLGGLTRDYQDGTVDLSERKGCLRIESVLENRMLLCLLIHSLPKDCAKQLRRDFKIKKCPKLVSQNQRHDILID